jgi:hypothetical protein
MLNRLETLLGGACTGERSPRGVATGCEFRRKGRVTFAASTRLGELQMSQVSVD